MKPIKLTTTILLCLLIFTSCKKENHATFNSYEKPGYVNFSLGKSTLPNKNAHQITLFGCNTVLDTASTEWHGQKTFQWNESNQLLAGVPFGYQRSSGKEYFISKYYIASPPVLKFDSTGKMNSNTLYDIGLVTPDEFKFDGGAPVQMVYLDYNILKPVHITYFDIDFGDIDMFIPFRVECFDFPWRERNGIKNGEGASGIGSLKKGTHAVKLFLPYSVNENGEKKFMDTRVSLLNDIILNYKFKFVIDEEFVDSINLKELKEMNFKGPIKIVAIERDSYDIPSGCKRPESGKGPFGK